MNRIINKRQAICGTVWVIVVCAVFMLWPLRLVTETVVSDSSRQIVMESGEIVDGHAVQQMFVAQYDRLKNIDIYFAEGTIGGEFNFVLYDASMQMLMQQVIGTEEMKSIPGDCTVQINIDTEVGRPYYYLLQGMETPFRVAFEDTAASGNLYNGTLYYENVEDEEHCIVASYEYEMPLRKGRTLIWDALFVLSGIAVTLLTGKYYKRYPERNCLVTVEKTVKTVLNPVIVTLGAAAFMAVWPMKLFAKDMESILFYEGSILIAVALALYAVNHSRTGFASDRTFAHLLRDNWQNYLQAALFAGAVGACCNYMNGLFEMHHTVAYRQMLVYLALAVLVTYKAKDIFNWMNLIYCVIAGVVGYQYYQKAAAALQEPEELDIPVIRLTAWVGILTGLILIGTIRCMVQGRIRGLSVWYGILVGGFFALIIWYRNTRGWPIYLVCAFTLFYLNMAAWEKKAVLLRNICNGILFHFGAMVLYCLLHRPYMFYQYYRYPFIFHTVTISAVYLALVVCAALVKFLDVYSRKPYLAAVYKELAVLGVSSAYLIFTLSRTGYLAMTVTAVIIIPVMCLSMNAEVFAVRASGKTAGRTVSVRKRGSVRYRLRGMLRAIVMMLLAAMLCFPVVFTAQRIVPSVKARPELHEIEEIPEEIVHGRDMDSRYYITIRRFVQVFQMKVLGVPEDKCIRGYSVRENGERRLHNELLEDRGRILVASAADTAVGGVQEDEDSEDSYTNGRMEIFRLYYSNLNKVGHEDMGIMEPNGHYNVHAHNIYLQVAYDHGIYVGAVFILLGIGTLIQAAVYFHRHKKDRVCAALPMAVLVLFAVAGLTEWIFHPCCPIACCLMLTLSPLLVDSRKAV